MSTSSNRKNEVYKKSLVKEAQLKEKLKEKCPMLYWAKEYHVNTRKEKMTFGRLPYLIPIYMNFSKWQHLVIEKAVQIHISELMIVASFYESAELGLTVFYVLPKYELRNRFVSNRVDKVIRRVAKYAHLLKRTGGADRLALKHFGKGTIAYVGSNVEDEFIEIPVDSAYVDEKDRCNQENLLMIKDRLTASPYKYYREASNPTIEGFGIDERYQISTRGLWHIKCDHCNRWFSPDFFQHVARQVSTESWTALDPNYKYQQTKHINLICPNIKCKKPVDRLKKGEWVDEFPSRDWKGLRINKLYNKHTELGSLMDHWINVYPHPFKRQLFYNSELGLPYTSKGAKLDDSTLKSCQRRYVYPVSKPSIKGILTMGIDVGADLHVIIRERYKDEQNFWVRRLVLATTLPSFSLLSSLIREWNPKTIVIDADPEIHTVREQKSIHKQMYACRFNHRQLTLNVNKNERIVTIDRTCILDGVKGEFDREYAIIPEGAELLEYGNYYSQLKASTRILVRNEKNPDKSYFSWEHSSPDHYFLAEAYCLLADLLTPRDTIIDFYNSFVGEVVKKQEEEKKEVATQTGLSEEELQTLAAMSPADFLNKIKKGV